MLELIWRVACAIGWCFGQLLNRDWSPPDFIKSDEEKKAKKEEKK